MSKQIFLSTKNTLYRVFLVVPFAVLETAGELGASKMLLAPFVCADQFDHIPENGLISLCV